MKIKHIFALIILFILFSNPVKANSDSTTSLTVSPAIIEETFEKGQEKSVVITIFNQSEIALPIQVSTGHFIPNEGEFEYESIDNVLGAYDWMDITPEEFVLNAKESKEVTIGISVPYSAEPGGHYATIYFEPLVPQGSLDKYPTVSVGRVGVLSLITVQGDIVQSAKLVDLSYPKLKQLPPVTFEVTLENDGNVHLLPVAQLDIYNSAGDLVDSLKPEISILLPYSKKTYSFELDKRPLLGTFDGELSIKYGDNLKGEIVEETRFTVLPIIWITITLIVLTLSIIAFIIYRPKLGRALKILFTKGN